MMSEFKQVSREAGSPRTCPFLKFVGVNFLGLHFHPQGAHPAFDKIDPFKTVVKSRSQL
jgi:hypothetical protein